MSTKTTFKRIALVAVAALGLGVLSVAPSSAAIDETLTLSASSATVAAGETATVTITNTFISEDLNLNVSQGDSRVVYVAGPVAMNNALGFGGQIIIARTSDSANAVAPGSGNVHLEKTTGAGGTSTFESTTASVAGVYTKGVYTVKFYQAATAGTYTYTISSRSRAGAIAKTATFTLTVSAADTTALATKSKLYVNDAYTSKTDFTRSDSSIVVTAGVAATPATVGYLIPEFFNASDTNTSATAVNLSGAVVNESMTVNVSGPGLMTVQSGNSSVSGITAKAKSVVASRGDTIVVWSDGTAGVATFTGYIGGVALTQAAKTVTFVGKVASFTATLESSIVSSSGGTANRVISFIAKDSAGSALKVSTPSNTGTPGSFYALYSDTKVVNGTAASSSAAPAYTACSYVDASEKWFCSLPVLDSGTVSITIGDSLTVATSVVASSAVSLTSVGAGYTGTLALDKSSYAFGEKAILTITSKDYAGNTVANGASNPFASMLWGSLTPTFTASTGSDAAGGTFTSLTTYLSSGTSFVTGTDTAVVSMPNIAGTYTLTGTTQGGKYTPVTLTFTVVDPNAASIAAAKDASDAATDAALEATDAAYAATDAANIAAEAADAATAAAEAATEAANAAKESADAATAAVEELATSVAKLMAALQAQITTLAKVVAKIAVKVKA